MDSINNFFFKDYDKLHNSPPPSIPAAVAFLLKALIHESATQPLRPNLPSTILFVCWSTNRPDSCFDSMISSVNGSAKPGDPWLISRLSLAVCSQELDKVSEYVVGLAREYVARTAMEDCRGQIKDATTKVADSERRIGVGAGSLRDGEMADVATWLSAALTDVETCVDGLEEAESMAGADVVKEKIRKAREYQSNIVWPLQ